LALLKDLEKAYANLPLVDRGREWGVVWLAAPWQNLAQGGLHLSGVPALLAHSVCWAHGSITSRHAKHRTTPAMASAL
jgi:hypothetical protein